MNREVNIPYFLHERLTQRTTDTKTCASCQKVDGKMTVCRSFGPVPGFRKRPTRIRLCDDCLHALKEIEVSSEQVFRRTESFVPGIVNRWIELERELTVNEPGCSVFFEPFILCWEARWAYIFGLYSGAIDLISSAVELAINTDLRVAKFNQMHGNGNNSGRGDWRFLNKKTMQIALNCGLPVEKLLIKNEKVNGEITANMPLFCNRRNKAAHGALVDLAPAFAEEIVDSGNAKATALDQLKKGHAFLISWARSEGNPAEKQGRDIDKIEIGKVYRFTYSLSALTAGKLNPYDKTL